MEDLKLLIANNIVKYRKMAGLTQSELAGKLNYSDKSVSKWERGDSLPDIIVLKQIANLFGISLESLTNEETHKTNPIKKFVYKIFTSKFLVSCASTLIVWLVATIVFVALSLFTEIPRLWLCFIYAIPVNFIVLICLSGFWKSGMYNFITTSLLFLSLALMLFLTFNIYDNLWLLFTICIPLIALSFIWFVARKKIFKRK